MGADRTSKYRVEAWAPGWRITPGSWYVRSQAGRKRGYGQPTADNLQAYVYGLNESFRTGVNRYTRECHINRARIVRQADGAIMAEWQAPIFEAI